MKGDTIEAAPSVFKPWTYQVERPNSIPSNEQPKMCQICIRSFSSHHAFQLHVRKHQPQCPYCNINFKSWKEAEKHRVSCSRKYGLSVIQARPEPKMRKEKLPWKCSLCSRRYKKEEEMIKHQIHRCNKRYITKKWIVKI